ncbi:hypothetical protein BRDCF_p1581 [Bacteroidales bacterium CF]|nr:hypothetical protein BRDCF_p1581 [Bacteroidales bacterium CF]
MKKSIVIFSLFVMFAMSPVKAQVVDSSAIIKAALDHANQDLVNSEKSRSYKIFEKYLEKCIRDSTVVYQDGLRRYLTDAFINTSPKLPELKRVSDNRLRAANAFLTSQDSYKALMNMSAKDEETKKIIREKGYEINRKLLITSPYYKSLKEKSTVAGRRFYVELLKYILEYSRERNQLIPYTSIIPINYIRMFDETVDGFVTKHEIESLKDQINFLSGIYYDQSIRRHALKHYVREMPSNPLVENYNREVELKNKIELLKGQLAQTLLRKNEIIANKFISNRREDSIIIPVYSYNETILDSFFQQSEELRTKHKKFKEDEKNLQAFLEKDNPYQKILNDSRLNKISKEDFAKRRDECFSRLERENPTYKKLRRDREASLFECNMAAFIHLLESHQSRGELLDLLLVIKAEEMNSFINLPEIYSLDVQINSLRRMIEQSVSEYMTIKYISKFWNYILINNSCQI